MKSELSWVLSTYARKIGCVNVKRNNKSKSWRALRQAIVNEAQNRTGQLVIYPEGTRTLPGQEVEYKKGVLLLASCLNRPIYLVSTNSGVAWSKTSKFKDNTKASINFIEKIDCSNNRDDLLKIIKYKIEKDSQRLYNEVMTRC